MKAFHFLLPFTLGLIACSNASVNYFSNDLKECNLQGRVKSITAKTTLKAEENTYGIEWGTALTKEFNQKGNIIKEIEFNDTYKEYGIITNIRTEYYYDGDALAASAIFNSSDSRGEVQTQYTEYTFDENVHLVRELSNVLKDGEVYPRQKDYTYENGKLVREEDLLAMFSRKIIKYSYPNDKTTVKWGMDFSQYWALPSYQWKDSDEELLDNNGWKRTLVTNNRGQIVSIKVGEDNVYCTVDYGKTGVPAKIKNGYADMFDHIKDQIFDDESVAFKYEYEFDEKGNWTQRTEYDSQNKVYAITQRRLQYYE